MNESAPTKPENKIEGKDNQKEQLKQEFIALAHELAENHETFPFPGISPSAYEQLKSDEKMAADYDMPVEITPVDELIKKFEKEGMRIDLGEHPESGNVFIVPAETGDVTKDSLFARHLQIDPTMNENLTKLIIKNGKMKRG